MKRKQEDLNKMKSSRILLRSDEKSIRAQTTLIVDMCARLNLVIEAFENLELSIPFPLDLVDLLPLGSISPRQLVMPKILPHLKGATVGERRISAPKLFDLMDIDLSAVEDSIEHCRDLFKSLRTMSNTGDIRFELSSSFFLIEDGRAVVNESILENWIDTNCRTFIKNDNQCEAYEHAQAIAVHLNALRTIAEKQVNVVAQSIEALRYQPEHFMHGLVTRIVKFDMERGQFVASNEMVQQLR